MNALWTCLSFTLLIIHTVLCSSQDAMIKNIIGRIEKELLMNVSHKGIFDLRDLVERRMKLFFASVKVSLTSGPINRKFELTAPSRQSANVLLSCALSPSNPLGFPTTSHTLSIKIHESLQDVEVAATFDPSSLKTDVYEKKIRGMESVLPLANHTNLAPIIPLGQPLNRFVSHSNAPRIYHRLVGVHHAIQMIILDTSPQLTSTLGGVQGYLFFEYLCWNTFLPLQSSCYKSVPIHVPISSIKVLGYQTRKFIKKGSTIATVEGHAPILAEADFILLSYAIQNDMLTYNKIDIDSSLEVTPSQQMRSDYLVQAYESGKLALDTYKEHVDVMYMLAAEINIAINLLLSISGLMQVPSLPSYHPLEVESREETAMLQVSIHVKGIKRASITANNFESEGVRERVARMEYAEWWNAFLPGSHVHFLAPAEWMNLVMTSHLHFVTYASIPIDANTGKELHWEFLSEDDVWFYSSTHDPGLWECAAVIKFPRISKNHDPELTQKLINLHDAHPSHIGQNFPNQVPE